jgi:hypothetical protein
MKPKVRIPSTSDKIYSINYAKLPQKSHIKKIIQLFDDGFTVNEICQFLGIPEDFVRQRVLAALERAL